MTHTAQLLALAEAAQEGKQTFYDGPLDWSDQRQALAYEAQPSTIKQLVKLVRLQHEAIQEYDKHTKGVMIPQTRCQGREAIEAFNKWEGGE